VEAPGRAVPETAEIGHTEGRAAQWSTTARRTGWSILSGARVLGMLSSVCRVYVAVPFVCFLNF